MDSYNRGYLPGLDLAAAGASSRIPRIPVTVHTIEKKGDAFHVLKEL